MTAQRESLRRCIEDLSAQNTDYKYPEQAINQAESLKSLSSDLYTDNIRFIYELIQNADDAQAKNINLSILEEKYFLITHDGNPFDQKDLQGLCGVNNGTKKKDLNKTGYKGLGFKSVFGKSEKVIIYSNGEYFRFDSFYRIPWNNQWGSADQQTWEKENERQFIYPWQINPIWTDENQLPTILLNHLRGQGNQIHVGYALFLNNLAEIRNAIDQLKQQPYMFLFLRNISHITFSTLSTDLISIESRGNLKRVSINRQLDSQWIIRHMDLNIPQDVQKKLNNDTKAPEKLRFVKKAEMYFAAKYRDPTRDDRGEVTGGIEKLRAQDSILFSYLPTKILDYKFPVLINANFLTNVNREQIHTDSPWNQWLFERIAAEIFQWIKELVQNPKIRSQAYRLIPSKLTLTRNLLSDKFNQSYLKSLENSNFILNRKNQLLKLSEVIMDSTCMSTQSSFINIDSMRSYIIDLHQENDINLAQHPFIDYDSNLNQIGALKFTWEQCIEMFKSDLFLQTHSPEHNKAMMKYFHAKCNIDGILPGCEINIKQIPFIMDQNHRLQSVGMIYFPAETIGDSATSDSDELFVEKSLFNWLNEKPQKNLKQWLQTLGVEERTDLSFLRKTIIPHASTYATRANTFKTITMLFKLFQKREIEKKELSQLRQLKLLTTNGGLVPAKQCFFSDSYKPALPMEEYLKTKMEKFVSFEYVNQGHHRKESEDLLEWRRFFLILGVHEDLHPIIHQRKLTTFEAVNHGFSNKYLSMVSPDEKHSVDAFSGLATISLIQYTQDNPEFATFFWTYVTKNIDADSLTENMRIYWGHASKSGAVDGTLVEDSDYISWFVENIKCIPTTKNTCEVSSKIFLRNKELTDLCGDYMLFSSISLPQEKTDWMKIFHFKTKLSVNDYFDLLRSIKDDEKNLRENLNRVQSIYSHMLKEMYFWTSDEQQQAKLRTKSAYLLTENDQWKPANELYLYMEGNGKNNNLNDAIPCLKLDFKNRNHSHLNQLLEVFNIRQIKMNDLKLADTQSSPAEHFRQRLIEISPFLKNWLKHLSVPSDIISDIDKKIQQENNFIESSRLQLLYNRQSVGETNVYFDSRYKQLYVRRPWDSETTFIDLPNKLCLLFSIQGFEKNIRFLLKGTIEEIQDHFKMISIEIPTKKDIVILPPLEKSDVAKPVKHPEPPKASPTTNNEQQTVMSKPQPIQITTDASNTKPRNRSNVNNALPHMEMIAQPIPPQYQYPPYDSVQMPIQTPFQMRVQGSRSFASVLVDPPAEQFDNVEVIDISTIVSSSGSVVSGNSPNGGRETETSETGRIGEEMVYQYLLKEHQETPYAASIKWLNQSRESQLPYDILLTTKNGKTLYIEVKSTRTCDQHVFPLSINQIEFLIQQKENYFIYRVYTDERKIIILDNIRWRLVAKQQLACFLHILPKSSE